jgi:DNA-binding Lrp family transcriptional regulator
MSVRNRLKTCRFRTKNAILCRVSQISFILDPADLRLLGALQSDASLTNAALAEKIGLSQSQVSRRRAALEAAGVILGYRAVLDPLKIGLTLIVFIHVSLDTHSRDNALLFHRLVADDPSIIEAHALTGEADYLLKAQVADLAALAHIVNGVLLPHPAVARVRSEISLQTLKQPSPLPLAQAS